MVNLQFSNLLNYDCCEASLDLCEFDESVHYGVVTIPCYQQQDIIPFVVKITCNETLSFNTIKISSERFGVNSNDLLIDTCEFELIGSEIPKLREVTILADKEIYDVCKEISDETEKFYFFTKVCNLSRQNPVVSLQNQFVKNRIQVFDCSPNHYGILDAKYTELRIVRVDTPISDLERSGQDSPTQILLKCLQGSLSSKLKPKNFHNIVSDDTIHAFTDFKTLWALGVVNGGYITVKSSSAAVRLQVFLLLKPNNLPKNYVYLHPRIYSLFIESVSVEIHKTDAISKILKVASSVKLSRVGTYEQLQKKSEKIILSNLKAFFTRHKRLLKRNQLIPVPFDCKFTDLCSENEQCNDQQQWNDNLVWYSVEKIELEEQNCDIFINDEIEIDPKKTKLVTVNIIKGNPKILYNRDIYEYYNILDCFPYNAKIFESAKTLHDIFNTFLNCQNKNNAIKISILLKSTVPQVGKYTLIKSVARKVGLHFIEIDCNSLISASQGTLDYVSKTVATIEAKLENVLPYLNPAVIYLSHIDSILSKSDNSSDPQFGIINKSMEKEVVEMTKKVYRKFTHTIFAFSTNNEDSLPLSFSSKIKFEILVPVPNEAQRREIYSWQFSPLSLNKGSQENNKFYPHQDIDISNLAQQSAGLTPKEIDLTIQKAKYLALSIAKNIPTTNVTFINQKNMRDTFNKTRKEFATSMGAPHIPNVKWADIGGIENVKGEILDTIDLPLKHPELFSSGVKKRSGILFYGPPGTGKTLMAKAIATNFSLNFFSIKGPELLNMYIGESEANVRRVFQKARDSKPCVIFFDELDSVAPKRGNQGDSGGVMDRIVSQLLAELDGMGTDGEGVFVIGATNRPDLLDEALLRPGRFDKLLYLGIPDTDEKQLNILQALTRKFELSDNVDLQALAKKCPMNYTGADFYALCSDSILNAITRVTEEVDLKVEKFNVNRSTQVSTRQWLDQFATENDTKVVLKMQDFYKAQKELNPSVSFEELQHYLKVKQTFET